MKNAPKRFFNKGFSCFGFNIDLHVFVKFGEQSVLCDSALCVLRLVECSGVVFRHFTSHRHPAHERHLFKLRLRGGRKRRADRTRSHTPEQTRRVQHTATDRGSFSVFCFGLFFPHLHEHNREPPLQGLKMWTEVGKLVLLHLLLTELHCAKGKTLVSASFLAALWGSLSAENRLVSVRDALCAPTHLDRPVFPA